MAATGYTAVAVVVLVVSNVLCYLGNSTTWLHHKLRLPYLLSVSNRCAAGVLALFIGWMTASPCLCCRCARGSLGVSNLSTDCPGRDSAWCLCAGPLLPQLPRRERPSSGRLMSWTLVIRSSRILLGHMALPLCGWSSCSTLLPGLWWPA